MYRRHPQVGLGDIQQGVDPGGYRYKAGVGDLKRRRSLPDMKPLR
jgi:hypothetical protein